MRLSTTLLPLLRRARIAMKAHGSRTRPAAGTGRALQDALDWNVQSRERRKRLGLE